MDKTDVIGGKHLNLLSPYCSLPYMSITSSLFLSYLKGREEPPHPIQNLSFLTFSFLFLLNLWDSASAICPTLPSIFHHSGANSSPQPTNLLKTPNLENSFNTPLPLTTVHSLSFLHQGTSWKSSLHLLMPSLVW